ncbi:hypothetical protein Ddye_029712 [Dipteronia dyeriana]|uniref:Uncharacterized protein n=1 Tax=Dipteronia dyeriana TaxID=168575 RepID=A0AAD9WLZ6_9ROSI|nr:hypothetical protein Ddye_029712 [Dipteronia dyeriana]
MSIPILEACRKRKRRPKLFGFHTFANPGCPINPSGQFCDNMRVFLQECAEIEDYNVDGMPTWCTLQPSCSFFVLHIEPSPQRSESGIRE